MDKEFFQRFSVWRRSICIEETPAVVRFIPACTSDELIERLSAISLYEYQVHNNVGALRSKLRLDH